MRAAVPFGVERTRATGPPRMAKHCPISPVARIQEGSLGDKASSALGRVPSSGGL
jgi:hypothetical protein